MKNLCIQLHPELNEAASKEEALQALNGVGCKTEVRECNDNGQYINFILKSDNLKELWLKIKSLYLTKPNLASASIITCEGSEGWNNYMLLHHFDKSEELNEL
ncbi:MAG: hypothetical protein GC149_11695 [Gammaproteobacteria bacterium]|nr:hypothetical protein [Gammaproteobacteria bacterium]